VAPGISPELCTLPECNDFVLNAVPVSRLRRELWVVNPKVEASSSELAAGAVVESHEWEGRAFRRGKK
jgi:hypothetical protein